ncbi:WecB/TagA/CpsF family glycosyltransferase [Flavobacterium sp. N2038]|uniref:WecB/TagA/CpsF family glycosyltransferase n=1 Tax=Flavobacterium sp. N2038 TaxID=2986829 RepID=UPI002224AACE|nr:WecB/TagA/CpsF family glycosyltransferase [Flavobacterium sp. N2038]
MKILIIHTRYQIFGGEDSVVEQELKLLKKHHNVEVLYFQNHQGWRGAVQFVGSIWNIFSAKIVREKIMKFKPDLVHIHNWHFALGPLVFREISHLKVPIVHTIHNYRLLCPSGILLNKGQLFNHSLNQKFPYTAVFKKVYRSSFLQTFWLAFIVWFHKKIGTWSKTEKYLCLTSFAVELFQRSKFDVTIEKFIVKPNFVIADQNVSEVKRGHHFLFVGRLSEEKGVKILLDAFKNTSFELKIAGDGPLRQLVLDAVKYNNIEYLGSLENEEVRVELKKALALILPSICYEGMPMTIIEAFSCNTPVITSNLGAMSSMVDNNLNGFHFEYGRPDKLREAIEIFKKLPSEDKKRMESNAYQNYKEKYSENSQLSYFNDIYVSIINKKKKRKEMINEMLVEPCLDYMIFNDDLSSCFTNKKILISTINQYSYCIAELDLAFKKALQESDILLPDGVGIVAAVKLLNNKKISKIAGADLHKYLLNDLNKKKGKCFYLGSSQDTLNRITKQVFTEFPSIKVETFSPPFKDEFSDDDNQQMISLINNFKPDVLFVGMTAPKQEKWANRFKETVDAKVICSIGAVFDFYAGTVARPNEIWINLGLEWFIRLIKEPKRMWRRYLYYGPLFVWMILMKKIKSAFN